MDTAVEIGITRERFKAFVAELKEVADKLGDEDKYLDHTIYCEPNGSGYGEEIQLHFTNDDMEAEQNPDIDGSKLWVSIERL